MSDLLKVDTSNLKNHQADFLENQNDFLNFSYNTFISGYFNSCSDYHLTNQRNRLKSAYEKTKKGYENISIWWEKYSADVISLENDLVVKVSDGGVSSSVSEPVVSSIIQNLPELGSVKHSEISYGNISLVDALTMNTDTSQIEGEFIASTGAVEGESESFWSGFASVFDGIAGFFVDAFNFIADVFESTAATLLTVVQSLVEGILQFGEALIDLVSLVNAGVGTLITAPIDFFAGTDLTSTLWENTKSFVSTQHVTSFFDTYVYDTPYGEWLKENTFGGESGFNIVRGVGNGVGYFAGIIALTIVTFGAGGAAVGAGSAAAGATGLAAGTGITATNVAVVAAGAGFSKGTEQAWVNGASITEGLGAGAINAAWEGVQTLAGMKIGTAVFSGGAVGNALIKTGAETVTGALDGFVQPVIQTIYKDGYVNDTGQYVQYADTDDFLMRYGENFNDNGGFTSVLTSAAIGTAFGGLGEVSGLFKNIDVNTKTVKASVIENNSGSVTIDVDVARYLREITDDANYQSLFEMREDELIQVAQHLDETTLNWISRVDALSDTTKRVLINNASPDVIGSIYTSKFFESDSLTTFPTALEILSDSNKGIVLKELVDNQNIQSYMIENFFFPHMTALSTTAGILDGIDVVKLKKIFEMSDQTEINNFIDNNTFSDDIFTDIDIYKYYVGQNAFTVAKFMDKASNQLSSKDFYDKLIGNKDFSTYTMCYFANTTSTNFVNKFIDSLSFDQLDYLINEIIEVNLHSNLDYYNYLLNDGYSSSSLMRANANIINSLTDKKFYSMLNANKIPFLPGDFRIKLSDSKSIKRVTTFDMLAALKTSNLDDKISYQELLVYSDIFDTIRATGYDFRLTQSELNTLSMLADKAKTAEVHPDLAGLQNYADNGVKDVINKFFGSLVTPAFVESKFAGLTNYFMTDFKFKQIAYHSPRAMAFNNGHHSVMNTIYDHITIIHSITHESLHQLSSSTKRDLNGNVIGYASGLLNSGEEVARGINEAVTEYFAKRIFENNYHDLFDLPSTGYDLGVLQLNRMIKGVKGFDEVTVARAFLSNDLSPLRNSVDNLLGVPSYFDTYVLPAFYEATENNSDSKLKNIVDILLGLSNTN